MSSLRAALAGLYLVYAVVSCTSREDVTPEGVCQDARRAIGLRTQACTEDTELAEARLSRAEAMPCRLTQVPENAYDCSASLLALSCDQVKSFGDDLNAWILASRCDALFTATSGTANACTLPSDVGACSCHINPNPDLVSKGTCEPPPALPSARPFCCAEGGYPKAGSCYCELLSCALANAQGTACFCNSNQRLDAGDASISCSPALNPEIKTCCMDISGRECACSSSDQCPDNQRQVPSCDPAVYCGTGAEVNSCSL